MQTASQLESVHLLRALLREASYLPDANARTYFRRYIVSRFRAYQPVKNANHSREAQAIERYTQRSSRRRHEDIIKARTRAMQRKGQKGLNYLRRATVGEAQCLEKILLFTYGRLGRRKYALQEKLLTPDAAAGNGEEEPAPLQKLYYSNDRFLSFFDAPRKKTPAATHYHIEISDRFPRLKTVLKTQHAAGITLNRSIKTPYLKTPIHNVWHRPMPVRRARNNVRRWYADTMSHLLPPLPNEEWDAIKAMIEGTKHFGFVKRRTPAVQHNLAPVAEDAAFTALVNEAIAMNKPSRADRPLGSNRTHTLNTRFMKRLYTKLFSYCCKLDWDEERNKWNATWGRGLHRMSAHRYYAPVASSLFAGVDDAGKIFRRQRNPDNANENTPTPP
ncbi:hypothetical protein CC80DRAFT_550441 [Byssothecium circinans]|uniref:LYR motif-containing protein Cup1-like N-terminal domain-containing protein n=1 Tax=Byssothecium circinans TaxID=147558 RepID=A0A6A5TUQ6_9PLEO|nr:hypothetical protein CC80DRAFT_550441 [Byssothecium circinans]